VQQQTIFLVWDCRRDNNHFHAAFDSTSQT
jgi:hypothetical protein